MNAVVAFAHRDMHRPLNRLEKAGWAVLAARAFGISSGEGAMLRELVVSAGQIVSPDHLASCVAPVGTSHPPAPAPVRVAVRTARIRGALVAAGFPPTSIENFRNEGYAVAPHFARRVRSIVEGSE